MNPLLMGALAYAPQIMQGVGNFAGGVMRGAGQVQAAGLMNTPAGNPAAQGEDFANRNFQNFGPNSQRGLEVQGLSDRQVAQNYNVQNKAANENMKRNYGIDAYKGAMGMAQGAIDSYLSNNNNLMNSMTQTLNNRY
jgi:hypothetical protein